VRDNSILNIRVEQIGQLTAAKRKNKVHGVRGCYETHCRMRTVERNKFQPRSGGMGKHGTAVPGRRKWNNPSPL